MAFVFREKKVKKIRPNTALGPGQYLPITDTKIIKSNVGRAPFESNVKKLLKIYEDNKNNPGPGIYYKDNLEEKSRIIENLSKIKYSNQTENLLQEKYLYRTGNNTKTKYNINKTKELLGFEVKDKRFKQELNDYPGPGKYFQENKEANNNKLRAKSAIEFKKQRKSQNVDRGIPIPSIPYNDNGFELGENNSLVKLEDPNTFLMFRGDKIESVGPGTYELDNPNDWHKRGPSWSKMRVQRCSDNTEKKISSNNFSKFSTRPQSAFELSKNNFSTNTSIGKSMTNRTTTLQMLKNNREKRKANILQMRKDIKDELQKKRINSNRAPLLPDEYYEEMEKLNNQQIPGPGYYINMVKESDFYKSSKPYPEFKQFFLSNNDRFNEIKSNEELGPTTYFQQNIYYNSSFNTGAIQKSFNVNKNKEAPFLTRTKRFKSTKNKLSNFDNPGPGAYNPKLKKDIEPNKFGNFNNTFNFRQNRFGQTQSQLKWQLETPGPGDYINPYSATGTANTLFINGLYIDIRRGKELLRPKSKKQTSFIRPNTEKSPPVGTYDPQKVLTIAYNNKKISKNRKDNEKLKIAFESHIKEGKKSVEKNNLGPGLYYRELPPKGMPIASPFQSGAQRMKIGSIGSGLEPGHYDVQNYFEWNKKTFNVTYL